MKNEIVKLLVSGLGLKALGRRLQYRMRCIYD